MLTTTGLAATPTLAIGFGSFGWTELIVLALLGVLIFGKRLPEVGRSIGKGIVEFKKGLSGIEDDIDQAAEARTSPKIESAEGTTVKAESAQPETEQA